MKTLTLIFLLFLEFASANDTLILEEIKKLREDTNRQFEKLDKRIEQVEKRIEQVEKRIDQVDVRIQKIEERMSFLENIVLVILAGVFASPFIANHLNKKDEAAIEELKNRLQSIMFALRELAERDENVAKSLKVAGL